MCIQDKQEVEITEIETSGLDCRPKTWSLMQEGSTINKILTQDIEADAKYYNSV